MKRWYLLLPILGIAVAVGRAQYPSQRPGDVGPGDGGATLRIPGMDGPAAPKPSEPSRPVSGVVGDPGFGKTSTPFLSGTASTGPVRVAQPPSNQVDINKDIEITDKHGAWLIYAMSYTGPDAPKKARQFALELRNNPKFKLNAYVYNYGAKEKLKEYQRVQDLRKAQAKALETAGVNVNSMPLVVRTLKIDEQTGVLIDGGFRTREDAHKVLLKLRDIKLDPKEIASLGERGLLDVQIAMLEEKSSKGETKIRVGEGVPINPFTRAFTARNPALPAEVNQVPQINPEDVKLMRKLNEEESFSLFQVKKPLTLVVKQYNTQQAMVKDQKERDGFLDRFRKGLTLMAGANGAKEWNDQAAVSAHNLCEGFRKSGTAQTYVLHAKYCSFVTVGGFDSLEDPELVRWQNHLESQFQQEGYRPFELMSRPAPMAVPR